MTRNVLEVKELSTWFGTEDGQIAAVDRVSFVLKQGEVLSIVGESGCGKSVTAQSIMRLYEENGSVAYDGSILYDGADLLDHSPARMAKLRGNDISMIFQDPMSALNPVFTIGTQLTETIRAHRNVSRGEARRRAIEVLNAVGYPDPETGLRRYPHELSGGMRQRVVIAIAIACEPKILIADEPTTALDVTIQAQIVELIATLAKDRGMAVVFISHDLGLLAEVSHRVAVMYLGQIVELGTVAELFSQPAHPYTRGLMASALTLTGPLTHRLTTIAGTVPAITDRPTGCVFQDRCAYTTTQCRSQEPSTTELTGDHQVRCWNHDQLPAVLEGEPA
ncbi:ABC transporter ATP-binding protein [Amycolatopsis sp. GM8]|uniref:ABC transporter ATP-binding protein n=1 Tax=Amycolatopsis sp. GM8 TaxID=2896530 RepID=UPI001F35906E|nr:ABC transporter ATP-binding protein [Amycolatopsis sp. GM8]